MIGLGINCTMKSILINFYRFPVVSFTITNQKGNTFSTVISKIQMSYFYKFHNYSRFFRKIAINI